jgi:hypothetical protein
MRYRNQSRRAHGADLLALSFLALALLIGAGFWSGV